jgi:hypothetical protein
MDDHRTLDEFLGGRSRDADAESPNDDVETDEEQPEQSDTAVDSRPDPDDEIEPTIGTYRWTPDGAACAACDTHVERRWRDGDEFVCADCKEW